MKVVDWGGAGTACCYKQCEILCDLDAIDIAVCCARFPEVVCVWEVGSDILFVNLSDVLFGVTGRCICRCSEDVQTCLCFCSDVLYELSERHSSALGHLKCCGMVGVWLNGGWLLLVRLREPRTGLHCWLCNFDAVGWILLKLRIQVGWTDGFNLSWKKTHKTQVTRVFNFNHLWITEARFRHKITLSNQDDHLTTEHSTKFSSVSSDWVWPSGRWP